MYQRLFKPAFDFVTALLLLFLLLPFLIFLSILIFFHFKNSPFFFQTRIGEGEKPFTIWKFRTMSESKNQNNELLPDVERQTQIGYFLRKTGIDEFPQLINILKGEMSFVGPRPLLPEYLPLYSSEVRKRHIIKPGITGLAQINGGNGLEWEKRFEFDLHYINNLSFWYDVKIFIKTFIHVLVRNQNENIGNYSVQIKRAD